MIETSSVPSRKCLQIFGNLRKLSEKCSETFTLPLEKFWKIFGNLRKLVGNLRKIFKNVVTEYYMSACGYEFYLLVFNSTSHSFVALTREISSWTLKIKFISMRGHVISSIYYINILMTVVLMIFQRFSITFRRFPKIFQNCLEGQMNVPEHFPRITENFRRCPKISEDIRRLSRKTRRCFDDTPTNLSTI